MRVELDLLSGRPNPAWVLEEPESTELSKLLADLPAASQAPPEPPGLGYRGFSLETRQGHFRIFGGFVVRSIDGAESRFLDARQAELWLIDFARERGWTL